MSRWISSALCTAALVAVLFCLPFWGIRSFSSSPASIVSDTTVSNVRIVKRAPKQMPAVVQPVQNENIPVIPAKPAETIPVPEQEEKPVEVSEQAEETSGEAVETVEAPESSDEATAADVQGSAGAEDSFSHTREAKTIATYKSYALGRIASKKTYPYAARSNGLEGKVRARVVINPDGTLAEAVILTPCEYELLNTACLAAIKKAAPFRKMSAGMSALTLSFVMDFSLE